MTDHDAAISEQMVSALCHFARSGNPNGEGAPEWRASAPGQSLVMMIGENAGRMGKPSLLKMIKTMLTNKAVGE